MRDADSFKKFTSSIRIKSFILGSLASSIFDPYTFLVGASGGVYALLSAQLANVILVSFLIYGDSFSS